MKIIWTLIAAVCLPAAAAAAQTQVKRDETGILPEGWSIDEEVKQLEGSVKDFSIVIKSLGSANTELQTLLTKHLKNPSDRVNSSLLEKKIAAYASDAVTDFDRIISSQDATVSNFRSVGRKLSRFGSYLGAKIESTKTNSVEVRKEVEGMGRQLEDLAAAVKQASTPEEERDAKQKFSRLYNRFRLQKRYADGYEKTCEGYQKLSAHMAQLNTLYATLKDKFMMLVANLETERKFLLDNMSLQEDSMKVKVLVRDGVVSGRDAIGKITEKMALLFLKVDAFNSISERVTTNMDSFNDFQQQMVGITEKLQQVGTVGDPKSLEDAIDQFYNHRFGDDKETTHEQNK
ncbi:MAG TPA: hypothetical protein VKW04_17055 [Planctomycetota bacterium]|nr:hypothetical protein [Planctomycetota bacterium]